MESQSSVASLAERLSGTRRDKLREGHKEHRLSKADIGGPIATESSMETDAHDHTAQPSMVMRALIIQRDEKGYGLTVSGDNPVYVQSVKEEGAAFQAGVHQGDRIVKVNGTNVTDYNHIEVVKLIKAGPYVALTLLGPPYPPQESTTTPTIIPSSNTSSGSRPPSKMFNKEFSFFDEKVNTIKKMLDQEKAEVERIKDEYSKNPNKKLLEDLGIAQKLQQDLEKQLWKAEKRNSSQDIPISALIHQDSMTKDQHAKPAVTEDMFEDEASHHGLNFEQKKTSHPDQNTMKDMHFDGSESGDSGTVVNSMNEANVSNNAHYVGHNSDDASSDTISYNRQIMNFEEDEFAEEPDAYQDHGHFKDFEKLRLRPAHTAVFINYVFHSHDPCDLLFILSVENLRVLTSTKEMLKISDNICKTYLVPNAPLKVNIDEGIAKSISDTVHSRSISEDALRSVFDPAVQHSLKEVRTQLLQFCNKREQGLSNCFGEDKISPGMDHMQEVKIVEEILTPLMHDLGQCSSEEGEHKINLKVEALQNYIIQCTGKRKSKLTSRMASMLRPKPLPLRPKGAGSMESIIDENKRTSILGKWGGKKSKRGDSGNITARDGRIRHSKGSKDSALMSLIEASAPTNEHVPEWSYKHVSRSQRSHGSFDSTSSTNRVSPALSAVPDYLATSAPANGGSLFYFNESPSKKATHAPIPRHRKTVIPVMQPPSTDGYPTAPGAVTHLIKQFQDPSMVDGPSSLPNVQETPGIGLTIHKKDKGVGRSGSFRSERRQRSTKGKSNSDPDVHNVELAVAGSQQGNQDGVDVLSSAASITSSISGMGFPSSSTSTSLSSTGSEDIIAPTGDPELDLEPESQWSLTTPKEVMKQLDKKEIKRQEVVNELLHTEKHHVRDLKILSLLFYQRMKSEGMLTQDELFLVFPNLQEVLNKHTKLKNALQEVKEKDGHVVRDIGNILLETFSGPEGSSFKEECAKYCGNQTSALEFIKERCKKDQKFNNLIQSMERHAICRRLQLKDFVPMEFQRLTKYPLLLENIMKNTKKKDEEEVSKLKKVLKQCKDILNYVNKAVKDAEDHQKIVEIQKNLDTSSLQKINHPIVIEYRNINLIERTLVHQGPLTWKITQTEKKKYVVLHCVLFEDIMVLLQKQDDRYVLKCHTSTAPNSKDDKSSIHPPILKLSKVLVRSVATDKKGFFVVSNSEYGAQIYELLALSAHSMQEWLKIITATAEAAKKKGSNQTRRDGFIVPNTSKETSSVSHRILTQTSQKLDDQVDSIKIENGVNESLKSILTESRSDKLTILQRVQEKHEEITAALLFKHRLLSEYAGIEDSQLENILDMGMSDEDVEAKTLVLQSILQANKLTTLLNDSLQPDTVFLQPPPQPVLIPILGKATDEPYSNDQRSSVEEDSVTPTPDTQETFISISVDHEEQQQMEDKTSDVRWADPIQSTRVAEMTSTNQDTENNFLAPPTSEDQESVGNATPDRRSTASLELVMSDYETASESGSPSPSSIEDNVKVDEEQESEVDVGSASNADNEDSQHEDVADLSVDQDTYTSQSDIGIGLSENQTDTESIINMTALEIDSPDKLLSHTAFGDLLDFGPALSPPTHSVSSPSGHSNEMLTVKLDTLCITKMLDMTQNMQGYLSQLLQVLSKSEEEKHRLLEENAKLHAQVNLMSPTVGTVEHLNSENTFHEQDEMEGDQSTYSDLASDDNMSPLSPNSYPFPSSDVNSPSTGTPLSPNDGKRRYFTFSSSTTNSNTHKSSAL